MYLEGELTGLAAGSVAELGGCYRKGSSQVGFGSGGERVLPVLGWGRFAEGSGSGVLLDCVSWGMSARHPNGDVRQAAGHELESRRAGNIKRGVVIKIFKSTGIDAFLYGKGMGEEADPGPGPLKA